MAEEFDITSVKICNCSNKCGCQKLFNNISDCINKIKAGSKELELSLKKIKKNNKTVSKKNISIVDKDVTHNHIYLNIINEILGNPNLKNVLLNPSKYKLSPENIKNFIYDYIRTNHSNIFLNNDQIEKLQYKIENYINTFYQNKCFDNIPLLKLVKDKHSNLEKILDKYINFSNYPFLIKYSIDQSKNYTNILQNDLCLGEGTIMAKDINFKDKKHLIHPAIVALYLNKLPILENLTIFNDSFELYKELNKLQNTDLTRDNTEILNYNLELLKLRLGEPNNFSGTDPLVSELNRISMHSILRACITEMRNKNFDYIGNVLFNELLTKIDFKYRNYATKPIGTVELILRTFSFKPTVVLKNNIFDNNSLGKSYVYSYDYKFDNPNGIINLNDNQQDIQQALLMQNLNPMMMQLMQTNMNQNMHIGANKLLNCGTLLNHQESKNIILNSIGILVINIERLRTESMFGSTQEVFNTQSINYTDTLTINNKIFNINSVLLLDNQSVSNCSSRLGYINRNKYNLYTLVKISTDKWFKYYPEMFGDNQIKNKLIIKNITTYMKNYYKFIKQNPADGKPIDEIDPSYISNFIAEFPSKEDKIKKMLSENSEFSIDNFIISDSEARTEIMNNSNVLIYAEDITNISAVCHNPCSFINL